MSSIFPNTNEQDLRKQRNLAAQLLAANKGLQARCERIEGESRAHAKRALAKSQESAALKAAAMALLDDLSVPGYMPVESAKALEELL